MWLNIHQIYFKKKDSAFSADLKFIFSTGISVFLFLETAIFSRNCFETLDEKIMRLTIYMNLKKFHSTEMHFECFRIFIHFIFESIFTLDRKSIDRNLNWTATAINTPTTFCYELWWSVIDSDWMKKRFGVFSGKNRSLGLIYCDQWPLCANLALFIWCKPFPDISAGF